MPRAHGFYTFIETLFHNEVTGGCAGGNYCPGNPVTRAQMAVFLLKAKFGSDHVPPPCTGALFPDVPCTGGPFDPWIEELSTLGITGGCGGGNYCPGNSVTRAQMAVFLLKTLEGSAYDPPDCNGDFDDVPCTPGTRILGLDRGAVRPGRHRRMLVRAGPLLPRQSQQPRPDGRLPRQDVLPSALWIQAPLRIADL